MIAKAVDTAKAHMRMPIMGASFYLRCRFAQRARNVLMEQCAEFQAHLAPQRMHALGAHRISVVLSVPRPRCPLPGTTFIGTTKLKGGAEGSAAGAV